VKFEAKYGGICVNCDERIIPGEMIRPALGDGFVHDRCPDAEPKPTKFQGTTLEDMGY